MYTRPVAERKSKIVHEKRKKFKKSMKGVKTLDNGGGGILDMILWIKEKNS